MTKKESFAKNRIKSIGFAYKGALYLIKTEASIKVQLSIAIAVTIAGFYFEITNTEWLFQIVFIGLVMTAEGINTAIEYIADFIHPEYHKTIGHIKDISAGAVFMAAIAAIIGAMVIYFPKLF
ncbi:diacylglycerol kinase family protein [Mangrovimonas sp. YM274]|uniref:diacylglycerol kinase family protein n=1 Tax=Mangrovimonas sp. YM274 TaxID=3070660 RepID=UPI0027DE3B75|nr:diacylglycerol kinase family protein [Mangrovimonas sp. YM274]WMI70198.1 diacylglycerol kinase family protein [Mangrovimonas sp. YM274]